MTESDSWRNYRAFAVDNNLPYVAAVTAQKLFNQPGNSLASFNLLNVPKSGSLSRLAQQLDGLSQQRWIAIEDSVLKRAGQAQPIQSFFEDLVLTKLIESPHIGLVRDSFSTGAQMAYAEKRFGVSLDDPDADLFGDSRIGKTAGLAALEIMLQEGLNKEGYQFPNLATFLSARQIKNILDVRLPENHPLEVASRRKITRRQLIGAYTPALAVFGIVGSITGGGGLLIRDGFDKLAAQRQDPHIIDLNDQVAIIDIKNTQIKNNLNATTDIDSRRQFQSELGQLKAEKEKIESERGGYKAQNYGGKWWRFLVGVPVTGLGVLMIVAGLSELPKDVEENMAEIKKHNEQEEFE